SHLSLTRARARHLCLTPRTNRQTPNSRRRPSSANQTIAPFLKTAIAHNVIEDGPDASQALLKTTSNFITTCLMCLISEAHVLASKPGLPFHILETLIQENFVTMVYSDS
ncbi:uncharacterized protein BDR25DRAFT_366846, partial [Lindgomyces ingoldianus]